MAIPTFYRKVGDRLPPLEATLRLGSGAVADLTGCTIRFLMRPEDDVEAVIEAAATIVDEVGGQVRYDWSAPDAALPAGRYQGEFELTDGTGKRATFPNDRYIVVLLTDDVD